MAEVIGFNALLRRLEGLRAKARNARPALDDAADVALDSIEESFEVGGRPSWVPHALSTLEKKIGPRRLLVEEGSLRGSFEKRVGRRQASVFPVDWKAAFHEDGTEVDGRPHVPARPFMHLQDSDVTAVGRIFGDFLFGDS